MNIRQTITQRARVTRKKSRTMPGGRLVLKPKHPNRILSYVSKKHPELLPMQINLFNRSPLRLMLSDIGIGLNTWSRILKNTTIMTTDEIKDITRYLKCKLDDLI
ncbi:MAG: hypothetical protein IPO85_11955 [Saprospiraceae bacterium]|uniref:HTH cro/C1-type domain-containing protein n=1 Tax=Candidatus Defluviibacterium haderslevense TaxID=2981993 RepID=A0A9D7S9F1_9BACT|nr:hypothetical protein [Candidatus Defluviibacterium haderslevense]